jgi:type IV pilus assembly protein PilZ
MVPPKSDPSPDRRATPRHPITLRVDYKRMNTFFADYARNISKGGTFIKTAKPLPVGTELVFVLAIPGRAEQLPLKGVVAWKVDVDEADRPAGMGIAFRFDSDADKQHIESVVEQLMADNLGKRVTERLLGKA